MKVKKGLPLCFLSRSSVFQPPSCCSFGNFLKSEFWTAQTYWLSWELPACQDEAEVSVLPHVGSWVGLQRSPVPELAQGEQREWSKECWQGWTVPWVRSALWGCTVSSQSLAMVCWRGGGEVFQGTVWWTKLGIFLNQKWFFFCLTLLSFLWFPPSSHPQKTTQIISSHSVHGIVKLQRALILMLKSQNNA